MLPLFHGTELVDQIGFVWTLTGAFTGFAVGCLLVVVVLDRHDLIARQGVRGYLGVLALPIASAGLGSYYARLAVEIVAFAGADIVTGEAEMRVDGFSSGAWVYLEPGPGARRLQIKIDSELYAALDPYRHPGRDCLRMPVEIGRHGVRRTISPALFESGVGTDRLVVCTGQDPA